jgi:hypothetical protein
MTLWIASLRSRLMQGGLREGFGFGEHGPCRVGMT